MVIVAVAMKRLAKRHGPDEQFAGLEKTHNLTSHDEWVLYRLYNNQ